MNDRFPGDENLIKILRGEIPNFIKTDDVTFPFKLYQKFRYGFCHGLICTQFLAAFR